MTGLLAGCGPSKPAGPRAGGVLHLALRYAPPLSPFHDEDPIATPFLALLYEGLVRFDSTAFDVVAAHAERWETSADGLTYTFHLAPGRKYEDGRPIHAQDYVRAVGGMFAMRPYSAGRARFWALDGALSRGWRRTGEKAAPLGAAAPDSHTVVLTLAAVDPHFLWRLADPRYVVPIPEGAAEPTRQMVPPASGPYRAERVDRYLYFVRNAHYAGSEPSWLDTIAVRLGTSARSLPTLVARGDIDVVWPEPPGYRQRLQREEQLRMVTGGGEWRHYLLFNGSVPPTNVDEVRRAVASGLQRAELPPRWTAWTGIEGIAAGPVPLPAFDPEEVRFALETVRRRRGLTLPVTVVRGSESEDLLESLAIGWAIAGLHAEARLLTREDYWNALERRGGFQGAIWSTRAPEASPTPWVDLLLDRALDPTWGDNLPHFFQGGETLDTLLLRTAQAADPETMRRAERELHEWIADRLPILPLVRRAETAWARPDVRDLRIHGAYGPLWAHVWRGQSPP